MSYKTDRARFENAQMDAEFERDCKNGTIGKGVISGMPDLKEEEKVFHTLTLESIKVLQETLERIEKGEE